VDENRTTTSEDERRAKIDELATLVRASRAHAGAMFDPLGERLQLVLEGGVPVSTDRALLLLMDLVCERQGPGTVVLPISAPSIAEDIASRHGCKVLRTKHAASALMAAATEEHAIFAGGMDGAYVFPDFTPAFDALASFCRFLEFLAAGVPSVDIIDLDYPAWHTAADTLDNVSPRSLQIVGDVVLAALPDIEQRLR
jgi:mannose-1-phosphate guanylyltransferase/phosphomannomutase